MVDDEAPTNVYRAADQRRTDRLPINAEFSGLGEGSAYVADLSTRGVFVHTSSPAPVGSVVELRFTVLVGDPFVLRASGKVVRHQQGPDGGMGVEFGPLSPDTLQRIEQALAAVKSAQ